MEILAASECPLPDWKNQVTAIFFESSSRKTFGSEAERQRFLDNWTGYYFKSCLPHMFLAVSGEQVFGYLMGAIDSSKALEFYRSRITSYAVFEDLFEEFPAHLHINCTASARGHGVGSGLIRHFVEHCRQNGCKGVHLVTSPDARNVGFYQRNGFDQTHEREINGYSLLFMGKVIS